MENLTFTLIELHEPLLTPLVQKLYVPLGSSPVFLVLDAYLRVVWQIC